MDDSTILSLSFGRKISEYSGDPFDSRYCFLRVSVLIQRYDSILFRETFPAKDEIDMNHSSLVLAFFIFFHPGIYTTR